MPRRHISQREAHRMRRELARLRRYAADTRAPAVSDPDCRGAVATITLTDYTRGVIEGAKLMPRCALIARFYDDRLTVYAYQTPEEPNHA